LMFVATILYKIFFKIVPILRVLIVFIILFVRKINFRVVF
jgi:hypothetical protein